VIWEILEIFGAYATIFLRIMKSLEGRFLALMRIFYGSDGSGERCGF
jgi:hypothetical protein